jgi:hypothetical protein
VADLSETLADLPEKRWRACRKTLAGLSETLADLRATPRVCLSEARDQPRPYAPEWHQTLEVFGGGPPSGPSGSSPGSGATSLRGGSDTRLNH